MNKKEKISKEGGRIRIVINQGNMMSGSLYLNDYMTVTGCAIRVKIIERHVTRQASVSLIAVMSSCIGFYKK